MQILSATQVANNFENLCELVYKHHEMYLVHRDNQRDVVIMTVDDFNGWQETQYLLANPYNAKRLLHSLEQARNGKVQSHEHSTRQFLTN